MSKIIGKTKGGSKVYLGALTPQEIRDADEFLNTLQNEVTKFQEVLKNSCLPSSLEYKYQIGEFLNNKVISKGISSYERLYVWEEIKNWVNTTIEANKDRGNKRQFYDYCYRLYTFGRELVFSFTWRQWSEFLDRSITTKDTRLLLWLKDKITSMREEDFRMFLLVINEYLKSHDTTIFDDEELFAKYEVLYSIVENWNILLKEFFEGKTENFTKARKNNVTKYKKKYVSLVLIKVKFKSKEIDAICRDIFKQTFVDIDTSSNFKK